MKDRGICRFLDRHKIDEIQVVRVLVEMVNNVGADLKLTNGGAAEKLDYLEVVHVLIRRPHPSR